MIITKLSLPVLPVCLLACIFVLAACDGSDTTAPKKKSSEHIVEVGTAEIQAVQSQLTVAGTLEAASLVRVHNEVSGAITQLPWHEGDSVKRGQLLVAIDDKLIQAELDKASAQKSQAAQDYQRLKKLKPRQLASDEEIARAATALDIAVAEEKLQRTRLALTRMLAPFDGIVTERHFEPGDVVALHSHILTLIDPQSLYLKVQLAESWIPLLRLGDEVNVSIDALGNSLHPARISRIYPTIDASTRKGSVEIEFLPIPFGVSAGQLARVELKSRAIDRLVIPTRAIHHDTQGAYVYVIDANDRAKKTYVKKGLQHGELLEVREGLHANDTLVIKGFIGLRDDKPVKIYNPDTKTVNTAGEQ